MKRFILLGLFVSMFFFTAICAAAETVIINDVPQKVVYNYILTYGLKGGFTIQSSSDYSLVLENNGPWNPSFFLDWGSDAKVLYVYNFAQTGKDTLLSYEIRIVQYPDTNRQRVHVASYENARTYFPGNKEVLEQLAKGTHDSLTAWKAYFNGDYRYGLGFSLKKRGYIEIMSVGLDQPAGKAGLKTKDRIVKINDKPVKDLSNEEINALFDTGDENATITLTVSRDKKETVYTLTKQFIPPTYKQSETKEQ